MYTLFLPSDEMYNKTHKKIEERKRCWQRTTFLPSTIRNPKRKHTQDNCWVQKTKQWRRVCVCINKYTLKQFMLRYTQPDEVDKGPVFLLLLILSSFFLFSVKPTCAQVGVLLFNVVPCRANFFFPFLLVFDFALSLVFEWGDQYTKYPAYRWT